jgi:hypothetical protein
MRHDTGRRMGDNLFDEAHGSVSRLETDFESDTLAPMHLTFLFTRRATPTKRQKVNVRVGKLSWRTSWCRWWFIVGGTVFFCSSPAQSASSGSFVFVKKGQPKAEIVVGKQPALPIAFAAKELQRYVKEMSGAELPIVSAPSRKPAIVLVSQLLDGDTQALDDPREEDHYRLYIDARNLRIEGASPRAALFGAYDILERLGCGWCVPGDDVVPKRDTLELAALRVDTRPAFQYRMMLDFPMLSVAQTIAISDWLAKNRMNWVRECPNAHGEPMAWYDRRDRVVPELKQRGLRLIVGGHTMHTWLPETHFASHPEWFAYDGGARKPPTLCVSNPEMTAELTHNMQRFLDRCPEADVIDLWHTDSEVFCHCSKCTRGVVIEGAKEKPPADVVQAAYVISYIEFVNRVAAAIARSHPKVMIGPLIYSQTDRSMPDGCPAVADNVLIGLAHFHRDSYRTLVGEPKSAINLRFLGNDLTWIAKSKHSYIYEYYNCWIAPYIYPGAQVIVRDLQILEALHVQGVSSDMYGYTPVNMYVAARALWSPNFSWKNAVRGFCLRYYGDVGEDMAANELRIESGIFGLNGYQASGARDPEKWSPPPAAGLYLQQQRPEQIKFLNGMIIRTRDPRVRTRLERALKPWALWNKEPRFWAFPEFKDSNER